MNQIELRNTKANHNKYWSAKVVTDLSSPAVICHWGRIGTSGQMKVFRFDHVWEAREYTSKKVTEKLKKGYHLVSVAA